jgi:ubiquinone/menaquinone biosynthesis C-methylase UbiE
MKRTASLLLIAVIAALPAAGQEHDSDHGATARHSFTKAERWAERFDSPERDKWQKPAAVMRLLGLQDGEHVADLGCGTGYFTGTLSALVGVTGKVYAVDVEQEMLDYMLAREDLPDYDNIVPVLAEPDDPKLPEGELDLILTVNTWHHIAKRGKYLKRLARTLKPYGRLVLIDWRGTERPIGPPAEHSISREDAIAEFEKAGWTLTSESVALPYQYVLFFRPPAR